VASQKFVDKIERGTSPTVKEGSAFFFLDKIERGTSPTPGSPAGQTGWGGTVREGSAFLPH
jgi:hypothetical protein